MSLEEWVAILEAEVARLKASQAEEQAELRPCKFRASHSQTVTEGRYFVGVKAMSLEEWVAILEAEVARLKASQADASEELRPFKFRASLSRAVHLIRGVSRTAPTLCNKVQTWREGDMAPEDYFCVDCVQVAHEFGWKLPELVRP